jgi:hypothetical protein
LPTGDHWCFGDVPNLLSAVPFLHRLMEAHGRARKVVVEVVIEEVHERLMQGRLLALHRQAIVRARSDDLARDLRLAGHRVDRDHRAGDFQHLQQFRDGRDFVALGVDDDLSEADVIGRCPGADHRNGRLALRGVVTAAQRLAVDGDHLTGRDLVQRRNPIEQALLKLGRLDCCKDGVEAVMRGNAIGQIEEPAQPLAFRPAEARDGDEIVRSADHRADGNDDHVDQWVDHLATARMGEFGKLILEQGGLRSGHGTDSWRLRSPEPSLCLSERRKPKSQSCQIT